jgi:hypothetical protein
MNQATFDIFRGTSDKDALWLEAVEGSVSASRRMEQIAEASPGQYFVFEPQSRAIIARIDTRKTLKRAAKARMAGAA